MLNLVLLAHGSPDASAFAKLRAATLQLDATFQGLADDLETRLLAGVAVAAAMFVDDDRASSVAALGVLSAQWNGMASAIPDLPSLADLALTERSERLRARASLARVKPVALSITALGDPATPEAITPEAFTALKVAAARDLKRTWDELGTLINQLSTHIESCDEELDLLWWALSDFSELVKQKWQAVEPASVRALITGVELAALTKGCVPLPSSNGLLARLLGKSSSTPVSLAAGIGAHAASLLAHLQLPPGHRLLPALSCLSEYRALSGESTWIGSVKRWDVDPNRTSTALALAGQVAREVLMSRAL